MASPFDFFKRVFFSVEKLIQRFRVRSIDQSQYYADCT